MKGLVHYLFKPRNDRH